MEKTYEEIINPPKEGTDEFYEFRRNHIGGSDIGTLMGLNPYKSPYMLWLEKIGALKPDEMNESMLRGKELEFQARNLYIKRTGNTVLDKKFYYKPWNVLIASVDGISPDKKLLYEAKCPTYTKLYDEAYNNRIPEYYKAQIQQYFLIINTLEICDYHVYMNDDTNIILNVYPDKSFHEEIIKKAKEFWHMVENRIQPPRREDDPYFIMDDEINNKALELRELKLKKKEMEKIIDEKEEELKEYVVDKRVVFGNSGLKAIICEGRETTDWKRVTEDFNLNDDLLNNYRKKSSSYILYKI